MSNQQEPPAPGGDYIRIDGPVKGQGIAIGREASAQANNNVYQEGNVTIDRAALKNNLMELYEQLGASALPVKQKMALQLAIGRAAELAEREETQAEALAEGVRQIGETFERTGEAIEAGSQVGRTLLKIVGIVGPLVAGGARIAAGWFGLPLP
jgi:hypothetical protein